MCHLRVQYLSSVIPYCLTERHGALQTLHEVGFKRPWSTECAHQGNCGWDFSWWHWGWQCWPTPRWQTSAKLTCLPIDNNILGKGSRCKRTNQRSYFDQRHGPASAFQVLL